MNYLFLQQTANFRFMIGKDDMRIYPFRPLKNLSSFCTIGVMWLIIVVPEVAGQVSIIPLLQEISVNRSGRTRFQLQIANRGSQPLSLSMHAYNLDISEGGIPSAINEDTERSCANWVTFTPNSFDLQPDEVQVVEGLVQAPGEVLGGYYSFITCEFNIQLDRFGFGEEGKSEVGFEFNRAVSTVLLVTVRSSKNQVILQPDSLSLVSGRGSTQEISLNPLLEEVSNVWQIALPVYNKGNLHTVANGEVSIWSEDMRLIDRARLSAGRGYVLPGKRRIFRAQGSRAIDDGIYMVKIQIRTKERKVVQGSFPFSVVNGESIPGAASDAIRDLVESSTPKFVLSDHLIDFRVTSNSKRTKGVRLTNQTVDTLEIYARVATWAIDDSGKVVVEPKNLEVVKPCMNWVEVSPNPLIIPPKRFGTAKVKVTTPEELDGEYYSAIVFSTSKKERNFPSEMKLPRTTLLTVSAVKNLHFSAEIESAYYRYISPLMRSFIVNIRNDGNVHCFIRGEIELYDKQWDLVMEPISFGSVNHFVLPQRTRGYEVPCPGALEPGSYEAVIKVTYNEESKPLISKLKFDTE